jgi:hypothetical protein
MQPRKFCRSLMEAWDRLDSAILDSDGNPIPVHGLTFTHIFRMRD